MSSLSQSTIPFPDEFAPPEQKETDEFGCNIGRAVHDMLIRGQTYPGYGNRWWNGIMSLYAQGRQPIEQYIASYRGFGTFVSRQAATTDGQSGASYTASPGATNNTSNTEFERKGLQNINFQNVPVAPKHISTIKSVLNEADYMVDVESNSKDALAVKQELKWRHYYGVKISNPLLIASGLMPKKYDWYPQNKQELEIYEKYHGYKLPFETGLLKILKHTNSISNWDAIFEKFKGSFLETGWACGRVCVNTQGAVCIEQIDPSDYVTAYREKQFLDEPPFAGHTRQMQIVELIPALRAKGASEEDIRALAGSFAGINGINNIMEFDFSYRDPQTNRYIWYDWYVSVLHFEWRTNDEERWRKYTKKEGTVRYARAKPQEMVDKDGRRTYAYKEGNNKNTDEYDIYRNQQIYEGDWVVGSKWILNYGRQKNVLKNSDGSTALSYFHFHVEGMPIVERWQPEIDQFQMAWLKLQAAVLNSAPDGFIIDMGLFSNMNFGFGDMDGPLVQKIRKELGNFYVKSTDFMIKNRINPANAMIPIKGGPGEQVESWMALMEYYEGTMRKVSGITAAMEGASDDKPELVGLMQGEMIATGNALYTIKRGLITLKEKIAQRVIAKARCLIEYNEPSKEYYSGVIGGNYVRDILEYKDLSLNQIGITLRAAPTDTRKNQIREYVRIALTPGKSGYSQIDLDDAMFIDKTIDDGYLELATWYLSVAKQRKSQAQAAQAQKEQEMNAQVQMASGKAVEDAKRETEVLIQQVKGEMNMKEIALKAELEAKLSNQEYLQDKDKLILEGTLEKEKGVEISADL